MRGTVTFSQVDPTPSGYTFTLVLRNASDMWRATSTMVVPTTETNPELRANGNGAHWHYISPTQASFGIVGPGATVVGTASRVGAGVLRSAAVNTSASACTVTVLSDEAVERASENTCDRGATTITEDDLYQDFQLLNCYLGPLIGRPPAQLRLKCVPLTVMRPAEAFRRTDVLCDITSVRRSAHCGGSGQQRSGPGDVGW